MKSRERVDRREEATRTCVLLLCVLMLSLGCTETGAGTELPARGQVFADSAYGSVMVRISDKDADGYEGNGIQNEYARSDAWSSDGSWIVLRSNDGGLYLYDAASYSLTRDLSSLAGDQELEPRWSADDPSGFWFLAGPCLMWYDTDKAAGDTVHDFRNEFASCNVVTTGVEGDASRDGRYWCFMVRDAEWNLVACCVYDREKDSVVGTKTDFHDEIDYVTMDASGAHAVIGYDASPMRSYYRDFSHEVMLPEGAVGHSDIALTAGGTAVTVIQNTATDWISMVDLETGAETNLIAIPFDVNTDIGLHFSGNCYGKPGWVLVSTYGAVNPGPGRSHSWMDNLLFMVELKADPRVVKMCETKCYTGDNPRSNYFAEAFASINRAGTKAVFGSNWGVLDPEDFTEAFEVHLPAGWDE
jgi:hypothetical protein